MHTNHHDPNGMQDAYALDLIDRTRLLAVVFHVVFANHSLFRITPFTPTWIVLMP
jgi:hypothetical protein